MRSPVFFPEVFTYQIINNSDETKKITFFDFKSNIQNQDPLIEIICYKAMVDRNYFLELLYKERETFPWQLFFYVHPRLFGIQIICSDRRQFVNHIVVFQNIGSKAFHFQPLNYISANANNSDTILVCIDDVHKKQLDRYLFMNEETIIETEINSKQRVEYRFCFNPELYEILKVYHAIKID
jgi:hypothetical protein